MKRGQYISYIENKDLMNNCINDYINGKQTQQQCCKKYEISLNTFKGYFRLYKTQQKMSGGEKKDMSIFQKKNNNLSNTEEKKKAKEVIDIMQNLGGRGGNKNKHSGFTDIIENHENEKKKQNNNTQDKKKKVVDLEEMYGTTKLLNKLDEERKKAEN
jgi:hypothetical protein